MYLRTSSEARSEPPGGAVAPFGAIPGLPGTALPEAGQGARGIAEDDLRIGDLGWGGGALVIPRSAPLGLAVLLSRRNKKRNAAQPTGEQDGNR